DYTERLVADALGLKLVSNSTHGYDATDEENRRYQIKGRRRTPHNASTQLSIVRNLDRHPFDELAAVVFDQDFNIEYAALIPIELVGAHGRFSKHSNGHVFLFRESVMALPGVRDIASRLRAQQERFGS